MADREKLMELVDHIEIEHERELAPGATGRARNGTELRAMHKQMHDNRDDWGHDRSRIS